MNVYTPVARVATIRVMTLALVHAEEHAMGRAKTPVIGDAILPAMFLPTKFFRI